MQPEKLKASLGGFGDAVDAALQQADTQKVIPRIWAKDASLWKAEEAHQKIIGDSLGWLTVTTEMAAVADDLVFFADRVRGQLGFRQAMVCGMGGSSLCPEVLRQTFGAQTDYPELFVLDSTDPDVLAALSNQIDLEHCFFIIASKSGTTTEPLVFHKYWYHEVRRRKVNAGDSFVAITDRLTPLVQMAKRDGFQRVFLNQRDIGGRYSALSYFGMVPAALMGVDIKLLLERAQQMADLCSSEIAATANPGARLGAIIGECAKAGRDKLTLVLDPKIAALGLWIEQLIAESTGKEGKGVVPVNAEPLGLPSVYGDDRLFVVISVGKLEADTEEKLAKLAAAGHPIVYRTLSDLYDLGEEFFLWEFATAFAGWRLGINPFDQPNVQESKDATKRLLEGFKKEGKLEEQTVVASDDVLTIYADDHSGKLRETRSVSEALRAHLGRAGRGDYLALLAFIEETPQIEATLQAIRTYLRDSTAYATTTGYGPRFLHSTGQLHKGGPDTGVFLQLTAPDQVDLPIPGEPYSFSILKQAQALGDFQSLATRGRRAIRVDLGGDVLAGLIRLQELIVDALSALAATGG